MKLPRLTIASIMGFVVLVALGFAAVKNPTELWAGSLFLATLGMLLLSVVGVASCSGNMRIGWIGFALFGFGYFILVLSTGDLKPPTLPTTLLINYVYIHVSPPQTITDLNNTLTINGLVPLPGGSNFQGMLPFFQIGHCLATWFVGLLGYMLVWVLFFKRETQS